MAILAGGRAQRIRRASMRRREAIAGLLFVSPWLIYLIVFIAYPVLAVVYLSFTEYTILEPPRLIGFENYRRLLTNDPALGIAVSNTIAYALLAVPLRLILALALALLMNMRARGIAVYRALFYLPSLVPPVVSAIIFLVLLNPSGPVSALFTALGLPAPRWFSDPAWSKPALILLYLWPVGVETLVFLAGLKEIPDSLHDAAAIDGAGPWQQFWRITLPLLTPTILFNLVIGIIYSFQVFDQAVVIGGSNGEPLESTLMVMMHIYRHAFRYFAMGYASALGVVLVLAILALTLVIFGTARLWVFYEADQRGV
jgi:multiple sugar transport system permease protein